MLYQKQECNGALYQMCLYSMGTMPGMSPRQEGGQTADNREGQAGDQPAAAQVAADAADQREFCERSGSVCVPDVCAGGVPERVLWRNSMRR